MVVEGKGERLAGVPEGMTRLWLDLKFRRRVREQVKTLGPFYQQIHLLPGLWTRPWNQATIGELIHAERGGPKWRRFVLPMIRPYLKGATVVELGTNSSQMLVCCLRAGARLAVGIEPDGRYYQQAVLVRQCLRLQSKMYLVRDIDHARAVCFYEGVQWDFSAREKRIGLLCAVLRHIPEAERVSTLERMGELCGRLLIQGSGLKDAPDGDNVTSILGYIRQTNLRVEELRSEPHVRGLRMLLRTP